MPGWNLNSAGFWVRDPSDEFLRAGIALTYTVNPTATAFVTYPPESSACANPDGPFPRGTPPVPGAPVPPGGPTTTVTLPVTGSTENATALAALASVVAGAAAMLIARRRSHP